jgi:ATP-dependent helicase HrpB
VSRSGLALPIDPLLDTVVRSLEPAGSTLVLQAPPGAGKTTRVPLALLNGLSQSLGAIWMLEPRRIAARTAAQRLAAELGEPVGQRVGYSVRLESRTSSDTRVEVLTAGLFLRRLQADPGLEGVGCLLFDEFHERSAEADLALALVREARSLLSPELRLGLMSATLDAEPLAAALPGARLLRSEGRQHPVAVSHQCPREGERLERQVLRALEEHWLERRFAEAVPGAAGPTVLVFLPGQREIQLCLQAIGDTTWGRDLSCVALHGNLPLAAQARAITAASERSGKVVLATAIAESSLTIAGVTLVIDAGLSRRSRFDPATGMDRLVTLPASQASAEQRAGRAGRLGPGRCVRLWSPAEQRRRPAFDPPELLEADPLPLALQLAQWGDPLGSSLPWLAAPPSAPLEAARDLLGWLGALDAPSGRLNAHGRRLARLGVHPRLGHLLVLAQRQGWLALGCELAALLGERDPLDRQEAGCDLMRRLDWLRQGGEQPLRQRLRQLGGQLRRQMLAFPEPASPAGPARMPPGSADEAAAAAWLVAMAYPERLAQARPGQPGRFLMRQGRGARVHPADPLAASEALAIAAADGEGSEARVLLALPLSGVSLRELGLASGAQWRRSAAWDRQATRVRREEQLQLGALVLDRRPWRPEDGGAEADEAAWACEALIGAIRERGLACLPWTPATTQLRQRLELAHRLLGAPWPNTGEGPLLERLEDWLGPHLEGCSSLEELEHLDLATILWGASPWELRRRLDDLLPAALPVASGRLVTLDYSGDSPVLAVKLQELFGTSATPAVLEGRLPVTVHLLSPAGRPAAITQDLAGFWQRGYAEVRRDLRGRYPKHPWPDDPARAVATAHTKARMARPG